MSERSFQDGLANTGRLSDQHHVADNRTAGNGRRKHARTTPALKQLHDMPIELNLFARGRHQRRNIDMIKLSKMLRTMQVTIGK